MGRAPKFPDGDRNKHTGGHTAVAEGGGCAGPYPEAPLSRCGGPGRLHRGGGTRVGGWVLMEGGLGGRLLPRGRPPLGRQGDRWQCGLLLALCLPLFCCPLFGRCPPPPPPVPWSGTEAHWEEWWRAMHVLLQRVHPVHVIRGWVREITASQLVARTERRVAERACALWAVLEASPGVLAMEDFLVGAFKLYVATGAMKTRASICNTPQGLGIAVPALLEALRWRYPGETSACLLEAAMERGGELAPLAYAVCPPLARGHGPGALGLYLVARLRRVPPEETYLGGGIRAGGCFGRGRGILLG